MDRIDPPADLLIPRLFDSWIRLVSYLGNIKEDSRKREPLGRRQFQGISCDIGKSFHGEILLAHAVMSRGDFFYRLWGSSVFLPWVTKRDAALGWEYTLIEKAGPLRWSNRAGASESKSTEERFEQNRSGAEKDCSRRPEG